jgi:hypothetical protein
VLALGQDRRRDLQTVEVYMTRLARFQNANNQKPVAVSPLQVTRVHPLLNDPKQTEIHLVGLEHPIHLLTSFDETLKELDAAMV